MQVDINEKVRLEVKVIYDEIIRKAAQVTELTEHL